MIYCFVRVHLVNAGNCVVVLSRSRMSFQHSPYAIQDMDPSIRVMLPNKTVVECVSGTKYSSGEVVVLHDGTLGGVLGDTSNPNWKAMPVIARSATGEEQALYFRAHGACSIAVGLLRDIVPCAVITTLQVVPIQFQYEDIVVFIDVHVGKGEIVEESAWRTFEERCRSRKIAIHWV